MLHRAAAKGLHWNTVQYILVTYSTVRVCLHNVGTQFLCTKLTFYDGYREMSYIAMLFFYYLLFVLVS